MGKEALVIPLARLDKLINTAEIHNNDLEKHVSSWIKMVETAEQYANDAADWELRNKAAKKQKKEESGSELEREVRELDADGVTAQLSSTRPRVPISSGTDRNGETA